MLTSLRAGGGRDLLGRVAKGDNPSYDGLFHE